MCVCFYKNLPKGMHFLINIKVKREICKKINLNILPVLTTIHENKIHQSNKLLIVQQNARGRNSEIFFYFF